MSSYGYTKLIRILYALAPWSILLGIAALVLIYWGLAVRPDSTGAKRIGLRVLYLGTAVLILGVSALAIATRVSVRID